MGLVTAALPLIPFLLPPIAGSTAWVLLLSPGAGFINVWLRDFLGFFGFDVIDGAAQHLLVRRADPRLHDLPGSLCVPADHGRAPQCRPGARGSLACLGRRPPADASPRDAAGRAAAIAGAVLLMAWSGFGLVSIPLVIGTGANIHVLSERIVRVLAALPTRRGRCDRPEPDHDRFVGAAWIAQALVIRRGRFASIGGRASARRRSGSAPGGGRCAGPCSPTWG